MNIPSATVTASPPTARADKADTPTGPLAADPAPDAGSVVDPSGAGTRIGFGRLLARQMDLGSANDLPPADLRASTAADNGVDAVTNGLPGAALPTTDPAVVDPTLDPVTSVATSTDPFVTATRKAAASAPADPPDTNRPQGAGDAVGNDLAAQIALASQWAALAAQPVPGTPAPQTTGAEPRPDAKGKLDAIRSAAAGDRPVVLAPGTTDAVVDGKAPPFAAPGTSALQSVDGTGTRAPQAATSRKSGPDAGKAVAASSGPDAPLAKSDALLVQPVAATDQRATLAAPQLADTAIQVTGQNGPLTGTTAGPSTATALAAPLVSLREAVGTPAWSHEVGQATLRLAASELQSASLHLNPDHLGPMEVQVRIDNGVANVTFTAAHAETRHALESSRTTLDQMFGDQGIKLGQCAVGDFGSSQRNFDAQAAQAEAAQRGANGRSRGDAGIDMVSGTSTVTTRLPRALGLVDTFA